MRGELRRAARLSARARLPGQPFREASRRLKFELAKPAVKRSVLRQARRRKEVLHGSRAVNMQTPGFLARPTEDFDLFADGHRESARLQESRLDRRVGRGADEFFVEQARNPETKRVRWRGPDARRGTEDDATVADYTRTPSPRPRTRRVDGLLVEDIRSIEKEKRAAVRDPEKAFRREKDLAQLGQIRAAKSLRADQIRIPRRLRRRIV